VCCYSFEYECHPNCRENEDIKKTHYKTQGISVQLEVFYDEHKGWGVKTLQDITKNQVLFEFSARTFKYTDKEF
jgi:hypothetical protein